MSAEELTKRNDALSVSAAMSLAKNALESVTVRLVGEVSEVSNKAGYKAVYFTVKDESASLPCMMWKNRFDAADVPLRAGMLVELTGRFSLYVAKGRMSFDVFSLSLAGEGKLRLQVANLAKALQAEGLMDASRKRPLPVCPETIGVVTSPRGAAVHDVLRTLRRRYPLSRVLLAGVPVEGAMAPAGLIAGLRCVADAGAEVVLLVRGGGSFEDLMPFNDEALARAISALPVPVVTGIGHEPDTSIADMVADVRASTPTAAAETVSPSPADLQAAMQKLALQLRTCTQRSLDRCNMHVAHVLSRPAFSDPHLLFAEEAQALDVYHMRLTRALPMRLEMAERSIQQYGAQLNAAISMDLQLYGQSIGLHAARLNDLSPLSVLTRGYAITSDETGAIVKSACSVRDGSDLLLRYADGLVHCTVKEGGVELFEAQGVLSAKAVEKDALARDAHIPDDEREEDWKETLW